MDHSSLSILAVVRISIGRTVGEPQANRTNAGELATGARKESGLVEQRCSRIGAANFARSQIGRVFRRGGNENAGDVVLAV